MPGFNINGDFGGHDTTGGRGGMDARRDYYYNYFWEIDNLFETSFTLENALISLRDLTLPTFSVSKEVYHGSSLEYKFAKNVSWDDIKVTWYDLDGLLDSVRSWRQSVWTPECGLRPANDYKKESKLLTYLPTGESQIPWLLHNSWPSQIRYGDLTYTTSEIKLVEVTVSYDWAEEGDIGTTQSLSTIPNPPLLFPPSTP